MKLDDSTEQKGCLLQCASAIGILALAAVVLLGLYGLFTHS